MTARLQTSTAQNSMAIDPQGLEALRRLNASDPQAAQKAVAKQFEALLMQQMLNAMRQANQGFGEQRSSASGLFRSMQDQQWAQLPAFKNGLGLTDAIVRQINQQRSGIESSSSARKAEAAAAVSADAPAKAATATASHAGGFVSSLLQEAQGPAASLGLSPSLLVAHAALETGWGQRVIRTADGKDSNNLFGIKAGSSWTGKTADVLTTEFVDGKAQKRVERFRAYDSYADAFADYASLLQRRFAGATGKGEDAAGFGKALQAAGYATDPAYAGKIEQVAQSVAARLNGSSSRA